MLKTPFTRFRLTTFPDLTTANAATNVFGFGDIICILGDTTRFKMGMGVTSSAKFPAAPTGKTFAQLPWTLSDSAITKTPTGGIAINASATVTAAQMAASKYFTSTSAAAVNFQLDTATALGTALAAARATEYDFEIDNTAGANTVTVVVGVGIVAATSPITGGATLTVIAGTFGKFKIIFKSATTALIFRTL